MITSHDAATSYFGADSCTILHPENNYVMTQQPGSLAKQLDCGARAFDFRPYQDGDRLVMHHGDFEIKTLALDALADVVTWAGKNPAELVVVVEWDCINGDQCSQMFTEVLEALHLQRLPCESVANLTLGSAMKQGRLPNGGSVLVFSGCYVSNYNPSIKCYNDHGSCYGDGAQDAFDPFWKYMASVTDGRGKAQSQLWMQQAHWQTDAGSIVQGETHDSCLLSDESKAGVNQKVAERIRQGSFPHINLLEVDNVCDRGGELLAALRGRFLYDISDHDDDVSSLVV